MFQPKESISPAKAASQAAGIAAASSKRVGLLLSDLLSQRNTHASSSSDTSSVHDFRRRTKSVVIGASDSYYHPTDLGPPSGTSRRGSQIPIDKISNRENLPNWQNTDRRATVDLGRYQSPRRSSDSLPAYLSDPSTRPAIGSQLSPASLPTYQPVNRSANKKSGSVSGQSRVSFNIPDPQQSPSSSLGTYLSSSSLATDRLVESARGSIYEGAVDRYLAAKSAVYEQESGYVLSPSTSQNSSPVASPASNFESNRMTHSNLSGTSGNYVRVEEPVPQRIVRKIDLEKITSEAYRHIQPPPKPKSIQHIADRIAELSKPLEKNKWRGPVRDDGLWHGSSHLATFEHFHRAGNTIRNSSPNPTTSRTSSPMNNPSRSSSPSTSVRSSASFEEWLRQSDDWQARRESKVADLQKQKARNELTFKPRIDPRSAKISNTAVQKSALQAALSLLALDKQPDASPARKPTTAAPVTRASFESNGTAIKQQGTSLAEGIIGSIFSDAPSEHVDSSGTRSRSPSVTDVFDRLTLDGLIAAKKYRSWTPPRDKELTLSPAINSASKAILLRRNSSPFSRRLSPGAFRKPPLDQGSDAASTTSSQRSQRSDKSVKSRKEYLEEGYALARARQRAASAHRENAKSGKEKALQRQIQIIQQEKRERGSDHGVELFPSRASSPDMKQKLSVQESRALNDRMQASVETFLVRQTIARHLAPPDAATYAQARRDFLSNPPLRSTTPERSSHLDPSNIRGRSPGSAGRRFSTLERFSSHKPGLLGKSMSMEVPRLDFTVSSATNMAAVYRAARTLLENSGPQSAPIGGSTVAERMRSRSPLR